MKNLLIANLVVAALAVPVLAVETEVAAAPAKAETVQPAAPEAAEASVVGANADMTVEIDADEKVEEGFAAFLETKKADGFTAYGKANRQTGITYFAEMEAVNGIGAKDAEFIQKRQTAFMRAYAKIREDFVKTSLNGTIRSRVDSGFLKDKSAEETQSAADMDQIQRLAQKTMALAESELDRKLEDNGVDPAKFDTVAAKRKALSQKILAECAAHAFGSCAGLSVVKTIEGKGTDGAYTIGVIAKFDPQYVYFADCMARGRRPQPSKPGINVGKMLASPRIAENFGTRFYYDEEGMPALVSFGQWAMSGETRDRTERKLQEKAAKLQAEAQANIDMNNFIQGSMTFDEATKGGEEWSKTISYDAAGVPVASEIGSTLADYVNRTSVIKANLRLAGREVLFSRLVTHPDTKQKIALAAIGWSFAKLDEQRAVEAIRRNAGKAQPAVKEEVRKPTNAGRREGDAYDF